MYNRIEKDFHRETVFYTDNIHINNRSDMKTAELIHDIESLCKTHNIEYPTMCLTNQNYRKILVEFVWSFSLSHINDTSKGTDDVVILELIVPISSLRRNKEIFNNELKFQKTRLIVSHIYRCQYRPISVSVCRSANDCKVVETLEEKIVSSYNSIDALINVLKD